MITQNSQVANDSVLRPVQNLNHIPVKRRLITHSEQLFFAVLLFCLSLTDVLPPLIECPINET
jgi:hypothetical protein